MTLLRFLYAAYLRLAGSVLLVAAATLLAARAGRLDPGLEPAAPLWTLVASGGLGLIFLIPRIEPHGLRLPRRRADAGWVLLHAVVAGLLPVLTVQLDGMPALASWPVAALDPVLAVVIPSLLVSALIVRNLRGLPPPSRRADALERRMRPAVVPSGSLP